jgi:hypothetical protein
MLLQVVAQVFVLVAFQPVEATFDEQQQVVLRLSAVRSLCLGLPPDDEGHEADDGDEEADDRRHHLGHGFGVAFFAVFFAGAFLAGAFLAGTSGAPSRTGSGNGAPSRLPGSAKLMWMW